MSTRYPEEYVKQRMEFVESVMVNYGAVLTDVNAENRKRLEQRATYRYKDCYYRVDSFGSIPCIVIEAEHDYDLANVGTMEDTDPFPCDYSDEKIEKEVRFVFGIEPYPENYPDY